MAAVASMVAVIAWGIPYAADRVAPILPQSLENRLGEMVDNQVRAIFGQRVCTNAEGQKAFVKLVSKLEGASDFRAPLSAAVLDSGVKNAIALPGGKSFMAPMHAITVEAERLVIEPAFII